MIQYVSRRNKMTTRIRAKIEISLYFTDDLGDDAVRSCLAIEDLKKLIFDYADGFEVTKKEIVSNV